MPQDAPPLHPVAAAFVGSELVLSEIPDQGPAGFLQKPYRADQLARAVRDALGFKAGRSAGPPE